MINDKLTILLVDDNRQFVERMVCILSELSIIREINVASSYEEAINILNTQMPDVALLDIHLPGRNGIELLKAIRHSGRPCHVMMVSNQADEYYSKLCLEFGADHFFDKSNDFSLIPDIIRTMRKL
jgi:DNA-binding NarL/FixJ family response regulator